MGRRIGKGRLKNEEVSDGLEEETGFVWDGSHLLQEVQPDGRYTHIYTDPDSYEPLAQVRNWTNEDGESKQEIHYFHCDQIGIPREMTDKDGNLVWFGNYTGWGRLKEETKVTDSAYQPFRLQNQYADRETGLHYNFFRYYEPDAGRFVNQDPIGLMGGENLYAFGLNTKAWVDPLGLASKATAKMQPYRFSDVSVKGPHADIFVGNKKVTEALLTLDDKGELIWKRFGDMKSATSKELKAADKLISELKDNSQIMSSAKDQLKKALTDFEGDLNDPKSSTRRKDIAKRGIKKFRKMLGKC